MLLLLLFLRLGKGGLRLSFRVRVAILAGDRDLVGLDSGFFCIALLGVGKGDRSML